MAKTKYKYNPDSLSFDLIKLSIRERFLRFLAYFIGSLLLALVYGGLFTLIVDSPKEKALKREIAQMNLQYELINREMEKVEVVLKHLQENDDNLYRTIFTSSLLCNRTINDWP